MNLLREPTGGRFAAASIAEGGISIRAAKPLSEDTQRELRGHDFYPADIASWPGL
ncbi:hypothetical protein ACX80Z_11525 [Arthrobacter sp. TMT4-20]